MRPVDLINTEIELVGNVLERLVGIQVLPDNLGPDATHRRQPETDVGSHPYRRVGLGVRPPRHDNIVLPLNA
jgi:hypothetical protein